MIRKPFQWSSSGRSHVGMVRAINEDACLVFPEIGLWAVADGMGGHEAGNVASQMVVEALQHITPPQDWQTFLEEVKTRLYEVNTNLREESARRYQNRTIGSTVVVLVAYGSQCACLWAGDSRIYRLRDGELQQLTRDHSHVQELVDQGLIASEEACKHPLANVITRAVGSSDDLQIDEMVYPLQSGDMFLLCSDGLNKAVSDAEVAHLLADSSHNCQEAVNAFIHLALMRDVNDNVTTVVVDFSELQPSSAGQSETTVANNAIPPDWYID
ncbi:MAG: serine/threonine protein phosphatase [Candidatus Contendobacter odensis]|uniref:Serine/threonine protein phosphatase n=1 Tax=Candidatus Contendibacter odensensis TaxID=1400860 RepID=A0A2G6PEZ8_9GAMM|nr:MAG: serine/threonine protein phosphatase [Candidatus Contendobacter odensis]